ncbi:alpha/beta-hydrolase family protein [Janibacter sp. CX7]|uniref:alpha/beta-hydrolase family protein n=1 Tax=Janibacter sp. CX7 TaxID=2963431 RepID=UPI0020CD5F83|nr:alpha/beta-hydrolase family protein [Janibacter sp. CX7]UTT67153.1 alpha/beta-hydrolase family protein [Janibacter sp. CX7]
MTSPLTRTALLTLVAAALWAALTLAGRPPTTQSDPGSRSAVAALTSGSVPRAAAALPAGFAADVGYTPVVEDGRLVNPTGSCSSPVPLPAEFEGPCRQHDLGYDLLRHAAHVDGALPPGSRQALDAQLTRSAVASCAAREGISRTWCTSWAHIAGFFVRANSVRQHDVAPLPEDAASTAAMASGAVALVGTGGLLSLGVARLRRLLAKRVESLPRVSGAASVAVGLLLSLSPAHLPHGPLLQGALTAVLVGGCVTLTRLLRPAVPRLVGRARSVGLLVVAVGSAGTVAWAQGALSARRAGVGLPGTDVTWWAGVGAVVVAAWLVVRSLRWGWARRRTAWRPALAVAIGSAAVLSGGPVHGAPTSPEDRVLLTPSPVGAVREYAGLREGEAATARAQRAATDLVRSGGLQRDHIVIAVPTGSGWINPNLVAGLERRFGSRVATVGMQYDDSPSWLAYLAHRDAAEEAAGEIFDAVTARVAALPADARPQVHVVGESLGATAGQAIFAGPGAARSRQVCSVLWTGTPGGHRVGLPREASVANADDPVVHASVRDLVVPPEGDRRWVPVVSAVHDAADFIGSLEVPDGSGHRYGADQAERLATC